MQSEETVSQSKEMKLSRQKKAVMLGEKFKVTSTCLGEYYNCLMEKCDPVQQVIVHNLRKMIEEYEQCVAKIAADGFTIQECMNALG